MNILVCGRMKEGKTSYALVVAERWAGGKIAWDPRHMIGEEMARRAGYRVLTVANEPHELEEAIQEYEDGELIVVQPSGALSEDFARVIGVLLDPPERFHNWALVVDEAATLQSAHTIVPDLDRIIRQHPRSALIVQTTHSLQDWHRSSRDLTDSLVAFRLKGRSLEAFIEYCDGSEEMREAIEELPRHYAIAVDMGAGLEDAEFRYVEPRTWWREISLDNFEQEDDNGGDDDAETSTENFEERQAEAGLGQRNPPSDAEIAGRRPVRRD